MGCHWMTIGKALVGLVLACLSGLLTLVDGYSGMSAIGEGEYSVFVVMANIAFIQEVRARGQLPIVEVLIASTRARHQLNKKETLWMVPRIATSAMGNIFAILTLKYIPVGDAAALHNLVIAFTMIGGRIFLNEECKLLEVFTLVLTLGGGMLVAQPDILFYPGSAAPKTLHDRLLGLLFGVATALSYASTNVIHYKRTRHIPAGTISFYAAVVPAVGYTIVSLILGHWPIIFHVKNRAFVIVTALGTVLAMVASLIAFNYNTAGLTVLVIFAAYMVFGFLFQLILGVIPNYWSIAGASCIAMALVINIVNTARIGTKHLENARDNPTESS